jgi:hypothetical protein
MTRSVAPTLGQADIQQALALLIVTVPEHSVLPFDPLSPLSHSANIADEICRLAGDESLQVCREASWLFRPSILITLPSLIGIANGFT